MTVHTPKIDQEELNIKKAKNKISLIKQNYTRESSFKPKAIKTDDLASRINFLSRKLK